MNPQIELIGWTHVHTYRESHGEYVDHTYQKEQTSPWSRRIECLVVSVYRDGRPTDIRTESDRDYLMARDIRANSTRYREGAHLTEPCCTAGSDDFEDLETGDWWRVYGVAGHGEWAFKI